MIRFLIILSLLCCMLTSGESQVRTATFKERAIYAPRPKYPYEARQQGWAGSGVFVVHVRPDGTVSSIEIAQSTGYSILDQAGIEAFRQWRFRRGIVKQVKINLTWTMKGLRSREGAPTAFPWHRRHDGSASSGFLHWLTLGFIQTEPLPIRP